MEFPSPSRIWQGAILHTIVHAIAITSDSTLFYEVGWDGLNYLRNDTMGTRGVITFHTNILIGAFSNLKSKRHIFHQGKSIKWTEHFKNASDDVLNLAQKETSLYLSEEHENIIQPAITTACWGDNARIHSNDDWLTFMEHGGHLETI